MAPIYDSDIAEERFAAEEWKHYELWERVEGRIRKRKWTWVGITAAIFIVLSGIPVFMGRWEKWETLSATRALAEQINEMKSIAATRHHPVLLAMSEAEGLGYEMREVEDCAAPGASGGEVLKKGALVEGEAASRFTVVHSKLDQSESLPRLVNSICYDPQLGVTGLTDDSQAGIGIVPVKDLTEDRLDRLSLLVIKGKTGIISFD